MQVTVGQQGETIEDLRRRLNAALSDRESLERTVAQLRQELEQIKNGGMGTKCDRVWT